MKTSKLKITFTIFTLLLTIGVYAQGPPGGGQSGGRGQGRGQGQGQGQQRGERPDAAKILSMLDTNNDEVIDKGEASKDRRGKISEDFDEIDSNSDEVINLEELEASLNNRRSERKPKKLNPKKLIKEVDDNGDGKLNELEVAAKDKKVLIKNFSKIDTNKDEALDLEELKAFSSSFSKNEDGKKRRQRN